MSELQKYQSAASQIKDAILASQASAAHLANEIQLKLYFAIGGFISDNTRNGVWGSGALEAISAALQNELPGLRGFSARNLKYMRTFYEEWSVFEDEASDNSALASAEIANHGGGLAIRHLQVPNSLGATQEEFFAIGFTHHRTILERVKGIDERAFYIREAARNQYSVETLKRAIREDDFHHQGLRQASRGCYI